MKSRNNRKNKIFSILAMTFILLASFSFNAYGANEASDYLNKMKEIKDRNGGYLQDADNETISYDEVIGLFEGMTGGIDESTIQETLRKYTQTSDDEFNSYARSFLGILGASGQTDGGQYAVDALEPMLTQEEIDNSPYNIYRHDESIDETSIDIVTYKVKLDFPYFTSWSIHEEGDPESGIRTQEIYIYDGAFTDDGKEFNGNYYRIERYPGMPHYNEIKAKVKLHVDPDSLDYTENPDNNPLIGKWVGEEYDYVYRLVYVGGETKEEYPEPEYHPSTLYITYKDGYTPDGTHNWKDSNSGSSGNDDGYSDGNDGDYTDDYDDGGGIGGFLTLIFGGLAGFFGLRHFRKKGRNKNTKRSNSKNPGTNNNTHNPNINSLKDDNPKEEEEDKSKLLITDRSLILIDKLPNEVSVKAKVVDSIYTDWKFEINMSLNNSLEINSEEIDPGIYKFIFKENSLILNKNEKLKEFRGEVVASCEKKTLTRKIRLIVAKEGLFIDSTNPIKIIADSETKTDLKITAIKLHEERIITDYLLLENIKIEFLSNDKLSNNAFETAEVQFDLLPDRGKIKSSINAIAKNNSFEATCYKLRTKRALPSKKNKNGKFNIYHGKLKITSSAHGEDYEEILPVELHTPAEPPESQKIEDEYKKTLYIIEKYVPKESGYQEKFIVLLDKWKFTWGSKGIREFRHQIWDVAQKLWEAKGLQGYVEIQNRIELYDQTRAWVQWAGDIALAVVLNAYTGCGIGGAVTQTTVTLFKQSITSLINHYKDAIELRGKFTEKDLEIWKDQELEQLLMSTPDHLITAASLKKMISPTRTFIYMFGCIFLRAMVVQIDWAKWGSKWDDDDISYTEMITDIGKASYIAIKECLAATRDMLIIQFLTRQTIRTSIRNNTRIHKDHYIQNGSTRKLVNNNGERKIILSEDICKQFAIDEFKRNKIAIKTKKTYSIGELPPPAKKMINNIKNGSADLNDVISCLKDTEYNTMRSLKNAPTNVQKAFTKTLKNKLYKPHDKFVVNHLRNQKNVPWGIKEIDGKPTKALIKMFETSGSSFSQDRDYVPKYWDTKRSQWLEIPERHWLGESKSWWKKTTGFEAESLQQMGMTRNGDEAFSGYATQKFNNQTGSYEAIDPHMKKVYEGTAKLKDGMGYGAMWWNKMKGANCRAERMAQLKKYVYSFEKVVKSHKKQGYKVPEIENRVKVAMEIIKLSPDDHQATPEVLGKINKLLKDNTGFENYAEFGRELVKISGKF